MPAEIHTNSERGHVDHGWLKAIHSFSFARFVNEKRMNFGALLVLNEDRIAPGTGFGRHFHDNMEIVTIPLSGSLCHEDSTGNSAVITAGDVQIMSAGTGILHSEKNASDTDEVHLLQIWIIPNQVSLPTRYEQISVDQNSLRNTFKPIVTPVPTPGALLIHQAATFSLGRFDAGSTVQIPATPPGRGAYLLVISGGLKTDDRSLASGDALAVWHNAELSLQTTADSHLLLLEVPGDFPAND